MTRWIAALAAAAALVAGLSAQQHAGIAGTWNMGLQGHDHVIPTALVLTQDGKTMTGTIAMPTQNLNQRTEVKMDGQFVDNVLTMTGTVENAKEPTTLELDAKLTEEGTLEGTLRMPMGKVSFTAERLKERK